MSKQESTKEIIDSYRKKQGQSWQNIALFVGAALLIIVGAALMITWLTGTQLDIGGIIHVGVFRRRAPVRVRTFEAHV